MIRFITRNSSWNFRDLLAESFPLRNVNGNQAKYWGLRLKIVQIEASSPIPSTALSPTTPPPRTKSLAMCYTSTGAALSLPPKKKDIYRPYSLDDRPTLSGQLTYNLGWRPAEEDLSAAHAILDLSASTPALPPPHPPRSDSEGCKSLPPPPSKTIAYTYEAFFVSDGRSKKKSADLSIVDPKQKYTCSECGKQYATSSNLSSSTMNHHEIHGSSDRLSSIQFKFNLMEVMCPLSRSTLTQNQPFTDGIVTMLYNFPIGCGNQKSDHLRDIWILSDVSSGTKVSRTKVSRRKMSSTTKVPSRTEGNCVILAVVPGAVLNPQNLMALILQDFSSLLNIPPPPVAFNFKLQIVHHYK
ncbi:unnamed protein product [Nesidiocoris tenuis]|uniref:C2H2-type domain-containing protein n=1 Tax=Nesidiocoris tenuis TaxID=355587 RepID=A0A6H5G8Y7_9HEMI|nr:unnamed protein product [Nesidiocoris tenuis]